MSTSEIKNKLQFPLAADREKAESARAVSPAWDLHVRAYSIPAEELAKVGAPPAWATQAFTEWCGRLVEVAKAALLLPADASLEFASPFDRCVPGAVAFVRSESFPRVSPGASLDVRIFPLWEPDDVWLLRQGFKFHADEAGCENHSKWMHEDTAISVSGVMVGKLMNGGETVAFKTDVAQRLASARRVLADAAESRRRSGAEGPPGYEGEARDVKNRAPATSKPASDHPVTIARAVNLIMRAVNEAEAGNTDTDRVKDTAFEVIGELVRAIHEERDGGKE